jgi:hypothetical protein
MAPAPPGVAPSEPMAGVLPSRHVTDMGTSVRTVVVGVSGTKLVVLEDLLNPYGIPAHQPDSFNLPRHTRLSPRTVSAAR